MKKWAFRTCIFVLLIFGLQALHVHGKKQEMEEQLHAYEVIPDDAIRLRILANSDDDEDQQLKELIRDRVSEHISEWVEEMTDINEARARIEIGIPEVEQMVQDVLHEEGVNMQATVAYGESVTFPHKLYGDYVYPAGDYEAVLITLGEGDGSNWWCVLFPPLCFLDFANSMTIANGDDPKEQEIEIKFFLFEWLGLS